MKKILIINAFLFIGVFLSGAQEIYYGTGTWNPEGLGNHRAVIYVERPSDAVQVTVPWRRLDNVDGKDLVLIDALTNQRIRNKYCTQKNNDFVEIVFEPVSGQGKYYLYFMPCKNGGSVWFPDVMYEKPAETYDHDWKSRTSHSIDKQAARTIAIESQNDYHGFYPMEVPLTQDELSELLALPDCVRCGFTSSIGDMIGLSRASILVASGSTFSMWASYLGRMPVVWHPGQLRQRLYYENSNTEIEFDPSKQQLPDMFIKACQS